MRDDECGPLARLVDDPRDDDGAGAAIRARAVELVKSADPLRLSAVRKQRVLLSMGQGWVRQRGRWLRPLMIGMFLLGTGTIASAALTSWPRALVRSYRAFVSHDAGPVARPRQAMPRTAGMPPVVTETVAAPIQRPAIAHRTPVEVHAHRPLPEQSADDPALLVQATHALRVDRDPKLARTLASRYLERHPSGTLADEAFAISIEAAIDHHDPDVAALSARYLTLFPRGSFRGLAELSLQPAGR